MVKGTVSVKSGGGAGILGKIMAAVDKLEVYVGIPEEAASRGNEEINNAELSYIHTHGIRDSQMRKDMQPAMDDGKPYSEAYELYVQSHGSPLWQSPPRPIVEPAIEKRKDEIAAELKVAVQAGMNGDVQGAQRQLHAVGQYAAGEVKEFFTDPDNGWPENSPATIKAKGSDRPLMDTGSLRAAITYVVKERE
ncbi:MAG: hypothetical protein E6X17_05980 [Sporomusaceae bacterium]|nr:hypothetical protein [Sporomusaceae bacterium]